MHSFETTDLPLVAFLHAEGFQIVTVRWDGPRGVFILADRSDRAALVQHFFNRTANVDALTFWDSIRAIKSLLYSSRGRVVPEKGVLVR